VNAQRQFSLLANIHQVASSKLDFLARAATRPASCACRERQQQLRRGVSGFLGRADTVNQGYGFLTPSQEYSIRTFQYIDRFTAGSRAISGRRSG